MGAKMNRIMVLLKDERITAIVKDRLEKHYQVVVTDLDQTLDFSFDLGIVDEDVLRQNWEQIHARKEADRPVFLPFLLITARGHADFVMRHLWQSVEEIIWTPINGLELQTRVENLLRTRRLSLLNQKLTITDSLTGLHNRRHFLELGERELNRARRFQRSISLIMSEIDHFQRLCDHYGYGIANQILRLLAQRFHKNLRTIDVLGRFNEDRFVLLLADTDTRGAVKTAIRLRQEVLEKPLEVEVGQISFTFSMGISSVSQEIPGLDAIIERAENALCAAIQAGRDQIMVERIHPGGIDYAAV
jgi:diguanylate cyclase (GGDEF)-like protein